MLESDHFDQVFDRYKNETGKFESQYIFVAHQISPETLTEKITKMMTNIDDIQNAVKRNFLKGKLANFMTYLEEIKSISKINKIYLLSTDIHEFSIVDYWSQTLKMFNCDNLLIHYDDILDIDWLKNLLIDRTYVNIFHFKGNSMKHFYLNKTKRKLFTEREEKSFDLQKYIQDNIPTELCIVHGISSLIKSIESKPNIKILNGNKKDDELILEYERLINDTNSLLLQLWVDKMNDPKDGTKIIFGNDITKNIQYKLIKTIFCSSDMKLKILKKIPKEFLVFDLIEVKTYGEDIGKRLINDFNGCIGIKFY